MTNSNIHKSLVDCCMFAVSVYVMLGFDIMATPFVEAIINYESGLAGTYYTMAMYINNMYTSHHTMND